MGILDTIKNKVLRRENDDIDNIGDIRSHVIGDSFDNQSFEKQQNQLNQEEFNKPQDNQFNQQQEFYPNEKQNNQFNQPPKQATFRRDTLQNEFQIDNPQTNREEPLKFENDLEPSQPNIKKNYEYNEKLDLIETNLSIIRSQTETINERLKNIEMKLSKKYY